MAMTGHRPHELFLMLICLTSWPYPSDSARVGMDSTASDLALQKLATADADVAVAGGAFGISGILSQAMLDSVLRREVPAILEAVGFKEVSLHPESELNVVDSGIEGVTFGVNISITKVTISIMEGARLDATIILDDEHVVIRKLRITPPKMRRAPEFNMGWMNFQKDVWNMLMNVGTSTANAVADQFIDYDGITTYNRNLCLTMDSEHGSWEARIVAWKVDHAGDLGVGVMLRPHGSTASLEKPEQFPLPFPKIYKNGFMDSDIPASERSRVALFFEDGIISKLTNFAIEAAVNHYVRTVGDSLLSHAIVSSPIGKHAQAQLVNDVVHFLGVADKPDLQELNLKIYREGESHLLAPLGFGNQGLSIVGTTVLLDVTNLGHGILESIFTGTERRSLLGIKKEQTEEDKKDEIAALRFGLCPAVLARNVKPS